MAPSIPPHPIRGFCAPILLTSIETDAYHVAVAMATPDFAHTRSQYIDIHPGVAMYSDTYWDIAKRGLRKPVTELLSEHVWSNMDDIVQQIVHSTKNAQLAYELLQRRYDWSAVPVDAFQREFIVGYLLLCKAKNYANP